MRPAVVECSAFRSDALLVEDLVHVERIRLEVDLQKSNKKKMM